MENFHIGCIGLGLMGGPIALNLIKAGYKVSAYARNTATLSPFSEQLTASYATPALLAEHCNLIITNVSDTPDVEAVLIGKNGVIHGAKPHTLVIDMSTISPDITRNIAKQLAVKDIDMLDAPVSGGPQGAASATLSIMVGGEHTCFEKALPIFQKLGSNIVHVGHHGAGQVSKACNQLVVAQMLTAISEAFILAKASGVDPAKIRAALLGGFAGSRILEVHGQRMLNDDFTPGFKSKLHQKDLNIVMQEANKLGLDLRGCNLSQQFMNQIADVELDSSVIYQVISQLENSSTQNVI